MDSAKMYGEDAFADEEPTKFEKWLAKIFGKSVENIAITVALVLGVALAVGLFVLIPQLISSMIFGQTKSLWRSLVEGVLRVGIYIGYLFGCSCIKDMKRLFMYHGAEHKTIACYEAEDELVPARAKIQPAASALRNELSFPCDGDIDSVSYRYRCRVHLRIQI